MIQARWHGYEIDSSEAAYDVQVAQPQQLGTLVRKFLSSGYFVRSYYLTFEQPLRRLHDFITAQGDEDKLAGKTLEYVEKQMTKFNPDSYRASRIGVRAIETYLNYVAAHRHELLEAGTFRFEPHEEQKEYWDEFDFEFKAGEFVDEANFYSERELPLDGVVLYLGCSLVPASKLGPGEQKKVYQLVHHSYKESGLLDEMLDWNRFMGGASRDFVAENIDERHHLSLRVRMNPPEATFTLTGRWRDDGQFIFPLYDCLLGLAATQAGMPLDTYCL